MPAIRTQTKLERRRTKRFWDLGLGLRVQGLGACLREPNSIGIRARSDMGFRGLRGFRVEASHSGLGFRVGGLGFRV